MQFTPIFSQLQHNRRARIWVATAINCRTKLNGRHPPSLPRPRTILRPPCTAWRPFLFHPQSCSPFCPPRSGLSVDKSAFYALSDSKSMRPSSHQADTLRCKAEPETGKQSGPEWMQDHQISRQSVARLGMWQRRWVRRQRISCAADRKKSNAR